jgi:alpha-ribazole phosphatase
MEIYLIRHTTPLIERGQIYGRMEVPLADSFSAEKERIIKQLPAHADVIYSSPSSRCTRLAAAIASDYNAGYRTDERLFELNFGDWEGQTWDSIDRRESETWMNDFVQLSAPNGETMLDMEKRIFQFWDNLLMQTHQNVCVVTHGGVIRIILARYRSVSLKDSFSIKVGMAEVFKLSVSSL